LFRTTGPSRPGRLSAGNWLCLARRGLVWRLPEPPIGFVSHELSPPGHRPRSCQRQNWLRFAHRSVPPWLAVRWKLALFCTRGSRRSGPQDRDDWLCPAGVSSARFSRNPRSRRHLAIFACANWLRLARRVLASGLSEPRNWVRFARQAHQARAGSTPGIGFVSHGAHPCTQAAGAPRIGFVWQADGALLVQVPKALRNDKHAEPGSVANSSHFTGFAIHLSIVTSA
jgi:hypothetical protein